MSLLFFIAGIIFVSYLIPVLDGISSWFLTWIELKKAKHSDSINQINIKMRKDRASEEDDQSTDRLIGFHVSDAEENETEEEP